MKIQNSKLKRTRSQIANRVSRGKSWKSDSIPRLLATDYWLLTKRSAFTLIELLLYMSLVALFVSAATVSLLDIILGSSKSSVEQEVQENLRYISYRVQFELRNADSLNPGSSFGINLASNSVLLLSLTSPSPDDPTEFRVDSGILQIKQGSGAWTALTSSTVEVTNLVFTDLSDSSSENTHFTITVRYRNPSGRSEWEKEASFEGGAQLR